MHARLTLYVPERPARQVVLDAAESYVVGREADCTIAVEDSTLSRRHARLEFAGGAWCVTDLCSKNGTRVGGQPVSRSPLSDDDWIEFGDVLACFDQVSDAALEADRQRIGERWQTSIELSRDLRPSMEPEDLLAGVLDALIAVSGAERGFVMLADADGDLQARTRRPADGSGFGGSRSVAQKSFRENRAVVSSNVGLDAKLGPQPSIVSGAISALACLPLRVGDITLGVIYVDSREPGKQFTDLDLEILQAFADHAALVVGVARLRESIVDLSDRLPAALSRDASPDDELVRKVQRLLPRAGRGANGSGGTVAVAGADR